jgi:hypothetical protein
MANIAPTCSASNLLTLPLPALLGEGIGRSYARLIKFTQKNAFGWALITCQPLKNRDRIRLFVLKIIKLKNGHFTLEKSLY